MFYSHDILQKRGGKFGKIWLAATRMSKLTRRDIAAINISKTCDDILTYVELRVAPVTTTGRRPRFSLYLSAQLMYGCARVHQKHSEYLLTDATTTFMRVTMSPVLRQHDINLADIPRADQVTNPEMLNLDHDLAILHDVNVDQLLDLPLPDDKFWNLDVSMSSDTSSSKSSKKRKRQKEPVAEVPVADRNVVRSEEITLQEPDTITTDHHLLGMIPPEQDLPMLNAEQLADLMGVPDPILPEVVPDPILPVPDLYPTSTPFFSTMADLNSLRAGQTALESPILAQRGTLEQTPTRIPGPLEVPEPRAVPRSPGVTQPIITSPLIAVRLPRESLELELTAMTPSPASRKRKKQLVFADTDTQISKKRMHENMITGKNTCKYFALSDRQGLDAESLLKLPGNKVLRKEPWMSIWSKNARFRRGIPDSELAEARTPPQQVPAPEELPRIPDVEIPLGLGVSDLSGLAPDISLLGPQLSPVPPQTDGDRTSSRSRLEQSVEELRKVASMSESGIQIGDNLSLLELGRDISGRDLSGQEQTRQDESLLDVSRQSRKTKKRKTRSSASAENLSVPQEAPSLTSFHTSGSHVLYDVIEEPRVTALPVVQQEPLDLDILQDSLLRSVESEIEVTDLGFTTFRVVCPPELEDRKSAARTFMVFLDMCGRGELTAKQERPYGDICIRLPS